MRAATTILAVMVLAGCTCGPESNPSDAGRNGEGAPTEETPSDERLILKMAQPGSVDEQLPAVKIEGVTETHQMVTVLDDKGHPIVEDGIIKQRKQAVREVWFTGIGRPFRVGDTLRNFGRAYTIIAINRSPQETSVEFNALPDGE